MISLYFGTVLSKKCEYNSDLYKTKFDYYLLQNVEWALLASFPFWKDSTVRAKKSVSNKQPVSIKRPYSELFERSLLNVPYDLKIKRIIS